MYGNRACETDPLGWNPYISHENAGLRIINHELMHFLMVSDCPGRIAEWFHSCFDWLTTGTFGEYFLKSSISTKKFEAILSGWTIHLRADSGVAPGPALIPNLCTFVILGYGLGRIVCSATIHE